MNLSYLPFLASGKIPENDSNYQALNAGRKKRVSGFVKGIPNKYAIYDINSDVEKLSTIKDSLIYKIVDKFQIIFVIVAIIFFVLYWMLFGFGWGLLTGVGMLILLAFLDKHLGNLFELTPTSVQLLIDYDSLVNDLFNAQKKEQKNNK